MGPATVNTRGDAGVLSRALRSTAVARAAVVGLTLGLSALAALAVISTARTSETTSWVRSADQVSEYWSKTFMSLTLEGEALNDYVLADSDDGREPLRSAVGSSGASLDWLTSHGSAEDQEAARSALDSYRSYTEMLAEFLGGGAGRTRAEMELAAQPVGQAASSLQKQAVAQMTRKRLGTYQYLNEVERTTSQLLVATAVIGALDLLLLALCALVLLNHQRRTERLAVRDDLTGLANRALLTKRMEQALRVADRYGEPMGLLLLDLNKFKEINDTLGHHAGDLLLQHVASRLTGAVRDCDTVARMGGDEFAVLMPRVGSTENIERAAQRVLAALQLPADLDGTVVDVRASIGVTMYPLHATDATELMRHADSAMYQAKRGELGTVVYDPADGAGDAAGPGALADLRRGLEAGELVLHYQPKARTDTARICGVEALVRWQHPVRGLVPPAEFIPLAEDSELIHPLTDFVLQAALGQQRAWRQDGLVLPIAVNVTAHSLLDPQFPGRLADLLAEHGTPPGQLTLELTETTAVTSSEQASTVLERLRRSGVRVSVDDFGAGYSSMAYLHNLPLDELKIDRQFVMAVGSSTGDAAIVRAILEVAGALGLDVVAEGVEDSDTLAALEAMGCGVAQGFYLCRPMPADRLAAWLAGHPDRLHSAEDLATALA